MKKRNIAAFILCSFFCLNNSINIVNAGANEIIAPTIKYDAEYSESYYSDIKGLKGNNLLEGLATLSQEKHLNYTSYDSVRGGCAYSDEDPSDPTKVIGFYTGWSIDNTWASGTYWNREHVWPQSLSNELFGESGAGSDIHHIRPEDPSVNGGRGNSPFAELDETSTWLSNNRDTNCYKKDGYFEPRSDAKGDVARILMYLYMHYSNEVTANTNFNYAGNLVITKVVHTNSGTNQAAWDLLMDWNELDPVDTFESNRNNYCASVTGVRNPFVDHSEFANMIWDSTYSGDGALNDSGSSTPVENYLKLSSSTLNLTEGKTYQLSPITNISNPSYTYETSNASVASVSSSGLITALSAGETTITVYCEDLSVSLALTVNEDTSAVTGNAVKYTVSSKNSVTIENAPDNTSATYLQTYQTTSQITSGNSATLTLSGYEGLTITGFTLSMKSNASKGAGSLTVTSGSTTIYEIENNNFNSAAWNGSYSSNYVDISRDVTTLYEVQSNENVVFTITATSNSLYIQSFIVYYSTQANSEVQETLSLSEDAISLNVDDTYQINPITNIENPIFSYSSSNENVATINSNGLITALSAGKTTITVSCNDLIAALTLTVVDEFAQIKSELEKIETKAQLDFGYTYTKEGSNTTATMDYDDPATTSTNMQADTESSELLNLDSSIFEVYASKSASNGNHIGLGKEGGTIRLYKGGNTLSVTCKSTINYIEIGGLVSSYPIDNVEVLVNGEAVSYTQNDSKYRFEINNSSFELTTMNTGARFEFETMDINYGSETINYDYFGNANIRYSASIPNELMNNVDSYGVNFKMGEESIDKNLTNAVVGEEETSFAVVLKNIKDFTAEITVTAYVYIDGKRVELVSKTYSIYSMVNTYIDKASTLGLNDEEVIILKSFKSYIENL